MPNEMDYQLKRYNFSVVVDFACPSCGRPIRIRFEDLEGPFTCRGCGKPLGVPPIRCREDQCGGIYKRCGGLIVKLSGEELEQERSAAWEGATLGGRATDEDYDDYRDIEGSIITYKCKACGSRFSSRHGRALGFDKISPLPRCGQIVCDRCGKSPKPEDLPSSSL